MRKNRIYILVLCLLAAVIALSGWKVASILLGYQQGERTYTQLKAISQGTPGASKVSPLPGQEDPGQADSTGRDFEALQAVNRDIVAWLSIPGTGVDYPVVQGEDNSYYLNHLATGEPNESGSIFLDYQAAPDFSDPYSLIYGHHMYSGAMFHPLMGYKDPEYYLRHPQGLLETPGDIWSVAFFSGFVAAVDSPVWQAPTGEEAFAAWLADIKAQSCFPSEVTPDNGDRIVALATCTYEFDNARFVLLGRLEPAADR